MKDAVYCYEKSLVLPEQERRYLDMHSIGMYAAKAYHMLGDQSKAVSIISTEIQKLRSTGRYEELWSACLLAAEIHYSIADIYKLQNSKEAAQKILSLYKGEYLADFEAFWAISKKIRYHEAYENALNFFESLEPPHRGQTC